MSDGDVEEARAALFNELTSTAMELMVNIGIMSSVAGRWPEEVQINWNDKIAALESALGQDILEIQEFASAFDEVDDEDEEED